VGDAREFAMDGRTFRLIGLSGKADEVRAAANTVSGLMDNRVRSANAALLAWAGPHAITFASNVTGILSSMSGFEAALRDRAAYLEYFPSSNPGGHPTSAATRVPAPSGTGTVSADPEALRAYVASATTQPGSLRPLSGSVNTDGVRGSYTYERALTGWERQRYLDRGWPAAEVDLMRVTGQNVMSASDVDELVAAAPVDGHVEPIVAASVELDAFVLAVATAFETGDTGLLDMLAFAPGSGGGLQAQTIGALVDHLQDPYLGADEMAAALGAVNAITFANPSAADQFVLALGPSGVDAVVDRMGVLAWETDPIWIEQSLLSPFAALVWQATAPGHLSDDQIARLADGLSLPTLARLMSSGARFDQRLLEPATGALWSANFFSLDNDPLSAALFHDDYGVAAINGLLANPELAETWLNGDQQFVEDIATSAFNDDGAAAGALLANVYYEQVLADLANDPTMQASLDASALALARLVPKSGFNGGASVALAQIATLHFDKISFTAEHGRNDADGLPGVENDQLVPFYSELFDSAEAQEISAKGLGAFATVQFASAADEAEKSSDIWTKFNSEAASVGALKNLFMGALGLDHEEDLAAYELWKGFGETVGMGLARAGISFAGATGGTSALLGVPAALAVGTLVNLPAEPSSDARGKEIQYDRVVTVAAARVLVDRPDLLERAITDAGQAVNPNDVALLRDDQFIADVLSGDQVATKEFDSLVHRFGLEDELLEITQEARIS